MSLVKQEVTLVRYGTTDLDSFHPKECSLTIR